MPEETPASTQSKRIERDVRHPYTAPVLRVFGTVASMTESLTSANKSDHGGANTKT
jgi:hypothetical protein